MTSEKQVNNKPYKNNKEKGNTFHIIPLIAVAIIAGLVIINSIKTTPKQNQQNTEPQPTSTSTLSPSPTPTQTATPTLTPTPKPTQSPTPTAKPIPTATPTVKPKAVSGPPGSGYSRITVATEKGDFAIDVISLNIGSTKIITDTASDSDCGNDCPTLSLADFVSRNQGFAGINGTYFCPPDYASCSGKKNSFDFPVYNSRLAKWINAGNLFWNDRAVFYQDGGGVRFMRNANSFSGGLSAGVVSSPGLVEGGNVIVNSYPLTDQQKAKGTRGGLGIRDTTLYAVIARNATLEDFAYVFKGLGAQSAINLDGGGSSALWFGGYKVGPGRTLPNAVIFANK